VGSPPFTALPDFTHVALDPSDLASDAGETLAVIPASAGVAQILGPEGKNLVIGRPANLRRWAATHLGAGRPPAKGKRPPTNLRPIAVGLAYVATSSPFQQKLLYERLMARHVPPEKRRDLKVPGWLHLDPRDRFPRVSVRRREGAQGALFGPFRDKRAADKARDALQRQIPLRPCDYVFEPDPALPLGLGCLFAQVRSCAAPCLGRTSEADYRQLAADTAARLARGPEGFEGMPPWAGAADGARGVVVDRVRGRLVLYPVADGRVLEDAAVAGSEDDIADAVSRLRWEDGAGGSLAPSGGRAPSGVPGGDWPWLMPWLASPRGRGSYVPLRADEDPGTLSSRLLIPLTVTHSSRGGA
jgi:hypothetical protein